MTRPSLKTTSGTKRSARNPFSLTFRRIMVGIDFSPASQAAFQDALKVARQNDAELLVVHIRANPISFMPSDHYIRWDAETRNEAKTRIAALAEKARQEGVHAHGLVLGGLPDNLLLDVAKKLHIALIIIGADEFGKTSRLIFESVTSRLLSHAPCSVLMVHFRSSSTCDM